MRIHQFIAILFLAASAHAESQPPEIEITTAQAGAIEKATVQHTPVLRKHILMVTRLGLADIRPGILLSSSGHILAPFMPPIDDTPAPYLALLPGGSRAVPEVLCEDEKLNFTLLKLPTPPPDTHTPAPVAPSDSTTAGSWFLLPDFGPSPLPGEPPTVHLAHRFPTPNDSDSRITLRAGFRAAPSPVFDLAGRLSGFTTRFDPDTGDASCASLAHLAESWNELADVLPEPTAATLPDFPVPTLPEKDPADDKTEEPDEEAVPVDPLHDALQSFTAALTPESPTVAVINDGKTHWHAIQGVILTPDGLILTKASELGPSLTCRFRENTYPAVLLATDEQTDLALLSIQAEDLPTITWADAPPSPGAWLHCPLTNPASPGSPYEGDTVATGLLSHSLAAVPASHRSVHSPEDTTSLGIVPEHLDPALRIAAVIPGSPAATADLVRGDLLLTLNDQPIPDRATLADLLATHRVGDKVTLRVERDAKEIDVPLTLGPARLGPPPSGESPPAILTIPSIRRSGFPETLVHDLPIESWQCGGPLYNSKGRAIGINIARAAFGRTLALPAPVITTAIKRMTRLSDPF